MYPCLGEGTNLMGEFPIIPNILKKSQNIILKFNKIHNDRLTL
jgi:hypothetical protein